MELFLKILFFILTIFYINISEAKVFVFDNLVSETTIAFDKVKNVNEANQNIENDFAITCKNGGDLLDFSSLAKGCEASAAKTSTEIIASNGIRITGFTGHGVNRAIGSVGRQGVSPSSILDTLKNPLKINNVVTDQLGRQSQWFIGQFGEVVVNPQTGRIISVNPTSSSKAAKLLQQLGRWKWN